jgi:uncharacterized protein (TIGR02444 family)
MTTMSGENWGTFADGLWRFSLAFYGCPGVANALIALQDRAGCNVNLVLFGVWAGVCVGTRIDSADLEAAKLAIEPLDSDFVLPLRRLRRGLARDVDPDIAEMRRRVIALELAAEQRVQARLARSLRSGDVATTGDRHQAAAANLALVLGNEAGSAEAGVLRAALAAFLSRD